MPSRMRYPILYLATVLAAGAQTLLETDQVRVVRAVDKPHVKTKPHEHKVNRVMIYLQAGRQEIVSEGKTRVQEWKAGDVKWTPASPTHTAEIISAEPVTMIEVELKNPGDPHKIATTALDPLKVEPKRYTLLFENPQVRVFRTRIGPKEKIAMHEHVLNRIVVNLTDQDETITSADGKADHVVHKAGDVSAGGPVKHREESLRDGLTEAVIVELKD